jgi:hypothetical protein
MSTFLDPPSTTPANDPGSLADTPSAGDEEDARVDRPGGLAQLRDRTDEIELIISGLTTFALFSLPSWLFERMADSYTHYALGLMIGATLATTLITGLCYGLGVCFLVHLLTRAYWVGLIGLRTVFPAGINWERTAGIGPLMREHYRRSMPDLDRAIVWADRVASSLFAVISLITLGVLWVGVIMLTFTTVGGMIGAQFGATNRGILTALLLLFTIGAGAPTLSWLLDAQLGKRVPSLQRSPAFRKAVRGLAAGGGWVAPQRLILPVQLTLQSNTRPVIFVAVLTMGMLAIPLIGSAALESWTTFSLSNQFRYVDEAALRGGIRSSHYEDRLSSIDRVRAWPIIDTFVQGGGYVPIFLPYFPLRDNPALDRLCDGADRPRDSECLKLLWEVRLNGQDVSLAGFLPAERADLRMMGLSGLIPLDDVAPGMHRLTVSWGSSLDPQDRPFDHRYANAQAEFAIPFLFAPGYELELDGETGRTPAAAVGND